MLTGGLFIATVALCSPEAAIGDNGAMVGLTPGGDAISRSARLESRSPCDAARPIPAPWPPPPRCRASGFCSRSRHLKKQLQPQWPHVGPVQKTKSVARWSKNKKQSTRLWSTFLDWPLAWIRSPNTLTRATRFLSDFGGSYRPPGPLPSSAAIVLRNATQTHTAIRFEPRKRLWSIEGVFCSCPRRSITRR
jgi:hypothetical protein